MNKDTLKSLYLCFGIQTFRKHLKCFNSKRAFRWTEYDLQKGNLQSLLLFLTVAYLRTLTKKNMKENVINFIPRLRLLQDLKS